MFEERFARIMQALSVTKDADLAKKLGITQPSIASAKKRLQIPTGWVERTSILANVSTDWLFFGRGPMHPSDLTEQPMPATRIAALAAPDPSPLAACPRCAKLEAELDIERQDRRDLAAENRQLWKENAVLRERLARYEERAIKPDVEDADPQPRPLA